MIKLHNIKKSYFLGKTEIPVLRDIDLEIQDGEFVALMGPSGSGKSTLLAMLSCIDTPTSGEFLLDNRDIAGVSENNLADIRNREIGVVFQAFNLIPSLNALQNVEAPLFASSVKISRKEIRERALEMLEKVGLSDRSKHRPEEMSGGQQQRVAIARALITNPRLLIADEPTGNLDSTSGEKVLDLFIKLHKELGITLIIATHDKSIASKADRTINIVDGKVVC
ncbi:MAG: ABC transporter ATP-binding protein [Clostridiales bacterium]|nr:ABC transporter ATP-binding protein [Clostridiales bacterium]